MVVNSQFVEHRVITENCDKARDIYNQSRYGKLLADGSLHLSLHEALYLMEKKKLKVFDRKKELDTISFINKARRQEKDFFIRYSVFADLRSKGYVVKTALKFGANFRVYDKGIKPGEDHAKWIVYPVAEADGMTWYEFSAKNRVAHSTKKRLLLGVVDAEGDVTYFENRWIRP